MSPWDLFEEALGVSTESERVKLLQEVLEGLVTSPAAEADRLELRAVVKCELSRVGGATLVEARGAVVDAEAVGRSGWPNFYLAEAALASGRYDLVAETLAHIPDRFFPDRDLVWRDVRSTELEALSALRLGRYDTVETLVDGLAARYAAQGDSDDLLAPRDLVFALMECERGRASLSTLVTSLDLNEWFRPEDVSQISEFLGV